MGEGGMPRLLGRTIARRWWAFRVRPNRDEQIPIDTIHVTITVKVHPGFDDSTASVDYDGHHGSLTGSQLGEGHAVFVVGRSASVVTVGKRRGYSVRFSVTVGPKPGPGSKMAGPTVGQECGIR